MHRRAGYHICDGVPCGTKNVSDCAEVPHGDRPKALLTNGKLDALVFLPDARNGYYRSTPFDWSGVDPNAPASGPTAEHRGRGRSSDTNSFGFAVWQLKDGEDKIIADRLVKIFSEAPKA